MTPTPAPTPARATAPHGLVARTDIDFDALARSMKPLGSPVRLKLLHLLTSPQYVEEIATRLKMSRQGVQRHLVKLVKLGVVRKQTGRRESGEVTEYVLSQGRLFHLATEFGKLGTLRPAASSELVAQTVERLTGAPALSGLTSHGESALVIVRGVNEGHRFALAEQPGRTWRIGRAAESEIRLDYDLFLSSRHAEVRRGPQGFELVDAFSKNGTWLNWARLEKGAATRLRSGDIIGVGKTLLVFQPTG